jgi:hypothetical protein
MKTTMWGIFFYIDRPKIFKNKKVVIFVLKMP